MKRWWILAGALVVVGGGIGVWRAQDTGAKGDDNSGGDDSYRLVTVRRGPLELSVNATGVVEPVNRVEIKSKASGEVLELPIVEGQHISRGELIARLDATDARADLARAKADLEIAQIELRQTEREEQRQRELFDKKIVSEVDLDNSALATARARASLLRAQTEAERTQERFDDTTVRAPQGGIVLQKAVEKGQIISSATSSVSGGTLIAAIADMSRVQVTAAVNEIDIGRIRVGMKADILADAYPQRQFTGMVVRIAPEAKVVQNVTQFDALIEVENPEGILSSGMNCNVTVQLLRKDEALLAPAEALQALPPGTRGPTEERTVLVKTPAGFEERAIKVGIHSGSDVEVLDGIKEGDQLKVALASRAFADQQQMQDRMRQNRPFNVTGSGSSGGARPPGGGPR
jgi:HlyD family secretion protein